MDRPKYLIVPYDEPNNIWILKKHFWWFIYLATGSAGSKGKLIKFLKNKGVPDNAFAVKGL